MSEKVKRYLADLSMPVYTGGRFQTVVLASDYDNLVELVKHCQIHSGYRNCGYNQMTTEQKQLYDNIAIVGEKGD